MGKWKNEHFFACHDIGSSNCKWCWFWYPTQKCTTPNCTGFVHSEHECDYYEDDEGNIEECCYHYFECDSCHKQEQNNE